MPSPVGHALGGVAAGWLADRRDARRSAAVTGLFTAAGMAADLDLLVGWHRGPTHSIGAAFLAGALAWVLTSRTGADDRRRLALAVGAAYASHLLLDWLGSDTRAPIGIPALWPLSQRYFESTLHLFPAISRRYWLAEFWTYNIRAVVREVAILGPIVAAVYLRQRRR